MAKFFISKRNGAFTHYHVDKRLILRKDKKVTFIPLTEGARLKLIKELERKISLAKSSKSVWAGSGDEDQKKEDERILLEWETELEELKKMRIQ